MPVVRIIDEFAEYVFEADVIAGPVSTRIDARSRPRPRWMEATLYRKSDGTYVLHQVNKSVVWHLDAHADSHVRKPENVPWSRLPRDAVYCGSLPVREGRQHCPLAGRRGPRSAGQVVVTELPQQKVSTHPDVHAVIRAVTLARRGDGSVSAALSEPMRELLVEAEENDPAFAGAARPVVRM
jgi:hypothetical protein